MIINIRGTGGSGKSTLVRRLMAHHKMLPCYEHGRKQPIGYLGASLYVVGHYETPCGGCDTLPGPDEAYDQVRAAAQSGLNVLYEGIMVQDDVRRAVALNGEYPLLVIALTTPVEDCLDAIRVRRVARGDKRELDPTNTVNRAHRLTRIMQRLAEAGVETRWLSRDDAYAECCHQLGLTGAMLAKALPPRDGQLVMEFES